ncbi:MAG TPA: tryptophan--tRNA ligase, partial [Bacillota bacterium]|nr:tryptophan--tRNA ligase [Bacillota bacterium]
ELATVPGLDGQKMSKSYGNTIEIFADEAVLKQKIMTLKTDSTPVNEPKPIEGNILYTLYSLFLDEKGKAELTDRFLTPGLRYGDVKKELLATIWNYFTPYREKRAALKRDDVIDIMKMGAGKARKIAAEYLAKARHNVGVDYFA